MHLADKEKLGFSDLTEDEGFLIVMYRDWLCRGPTRAIAEHSIARALKNDQFGPVLDDVFRVFHAVDADTIDTRDPGTVLTVHEEQVLTKLAVHFNADAALSSKIHIRPADKIHRSGHDRLQGDVDAAYWASVALHASKPNRMN